ncbi:HAMP domain-containing protein [Candidatus Poribacteria bacterium]|nr:HAMP domain-containing protein [Candidatus Poribacteria bacterium]
MHISKFQLKLTFIFLLILFVAAVIASLFTWYILSIKNTVLDVEKMVEEVIMDVSDFTYNIIQESEIECQSIAEGMASDKELISAMDSYDEIEDVVFEIFPAGDNYLISVYKYHASTDEIAVAFISSDNNSELDATLVSKTIETNAPMSYQEEDIVYGAAPVLSGEDIKGVILVKQQLEQDLVKNLMALQNLLGVYTLRTDIDSFVWIGILVVFLIIAIGGLILAALLARSVTKPILSLVEATREIGKGNLDYKVKVKGKDEIADLVNSFNSMVSQLKSTRERLVVVERLAAWRDIARRIAHEIKNPLTPIQLSMYRLRKNLGSDRYNEIFDQAYNSITNEVENLKNMVTEFSQFARMPKPRTNLASPREIVQDSIDLYTGLPENIKLNLDISDNLPQIMADKDQIRQVLHNLIGNAVDAMDDGGELSVRLYKDNDEVIIKVADTGCGMSEEVRQKMFTPYFTTKETGTGLGMAITAQIIEEHGGSISIESEEGKGTEVILRFKPGTETEDDKL